MSGWLCNHRGVMEPDMIGLVRLYRTEDGGKKLPLEPDHKYYSSIAMTDPEMREGHSLRLIIGGLPALMMPGESAEMPMKFLTDEGARVMREAGRFYLWEGRFIGEVEVRG